MTDETVTTCSALTKAGTPCTKTWGLLDGMCVFHHPGRADELLEMRQRGQLKAAETRKQNNRIRAALASETAGQRPPVGTTLETVSEFGRWVLEASVRRELTPAEATALMTGLQKLEGIYTRRDLEKQLRALQRDYAALRKRLGRAA